MKLSLGEFIERSGIRSAGDLGKAQQGYVGRGDDKTIAATEPILLREKQAYSVVDSAVQTMILENLGKVFPKEMNVVVEEKDETSQKLIDQYYLKKNILEENVLTLVIDPIDGSSNYLDGSDFWAVSLALLSGTEPVLGAMYFPNLNVMLSAEKGQGTWLNDNRLTISNSLAFAPEQPVRISSSIGEQEKDWIARTTKSRHTGSLCVTFLSLFATVCLKPISSLLPPCHAYIGGNTLLYDLGAGPLLWQEAGGVVVDLAGIASNPYASVLHDQGGDLRVKKIFLRAPNIGYEKKLLHHLHLS